jgi:hypothetical protein
MMGRLSWSSNPPSWSSSLPPLPPFCVKRAVQETASQEKKKRIDPRLFSSPLASPRWTNGDATNGPKGS